MHMHMLESNIIVPHPMNHQRDFPNTAARSQYKSSNSTSRNTGTGVAARNSRLPFTREIRTYFPKYGVLGGDLQLSSPKKKIDSN